MKIVGILQKEQKVTPFIEKLIEESDSLEIGLIIFTLEDLQIDRGLVSGLLYNDQKWSKKEMAIPLFIDVDPHLFDSVASRKALKKLRSYSKLSSTVRYPLLRSRYKKYFPEDSYFHDYVIFYEKVKDIEELQSLISQYGTVRLILSRKNDRRLLIQLKKGRYLIYREQDKVLVSEELISIEPYLMNKGCYVERVVPSILGPLTEISGFAHFEKGAEGQWILIETKVNSEDLLTYYEQHYNEQSEELNRIAEEHLYRFARGVEVNRKRTFPDLIIYFSIDVSGRLHFGRVTRNYNLDKHLERIAQLRVSYYEYQLEQLGALQIQSEAELIQLRSENEKIEKALLQHQEEEKRKEELIEQGVLKPEKKEWTSFKTLIIIALIFVLFRYILKVAF